MKKTEEFRELEHKCVYVCVCVCVCVYVCAVHMYIHMWSDVQYVMCEV